MSWPFLAVFFSGWLYVDATYRGPHWQRWLFKPVTLLLLLFWAYTAPVMTLYSYLIVAGLVATMIGDALLQLPTERFLYALGAFFLAHLLYTLNFASQMTLTLFWPLPLALVVIGALLVVFIWSRLAEMRWAVVTYIAMTLLMVWIAGERYFVLESALSLSIFIGSALLLFSNMVWLLNRYRFKFRIADAIVAAGYFGGHFLIVRSLYL